MKKQHLAFVLGGFAMALSGLAINACSSDDTGVNDAGGKDSTAQDTGKADSGGGNDTGTNDTGTTDTGTDSNCGSTPSLHVTEAGTIFCGYLPDGGPAFNCPTGQQCCLGGSTGGSTFADQKCVAFGGTCDNPPPDGGTPIECSQNADCTANGKTNNVCCLQGSGTPAIVSGCGYYKTSGGKDITCEAADAGACATGEVQICSQQSDCPSGKTCTPMKWKLYQLGFCL